MNTIIIWDSCGVEEIKFFNLLGDYSRFNNCYINSVDCSSEILDEMLDLFYPNNKSLEPTPLYDFPKSLVFENTVIVACGELP